MQMCPMNLTGADFYSLCSDAMLNAVKRAIDLQKGRFHFNFLGIMRCQRYISILAFPPDMPAVMPIFAGRNLFVVMFFCVGL